MLRPRQLQLVSVSTCTRHRYRPNLNPTSALDGFLWRPRSCGALNRAAYYATVSSSSSHFNANNTDEKLDSKQEKEREQKNAFPYPTSKNPTPHQIFHLPPGASQKEIKERYFDLVRTHHPDSHHTALLPPPVAHARFRSIKASYDYLSGRTLSPHPNARPTPEPKEFDPYMHELARRRRAYYAAQGRYRGGGGTGGMGGEEGEGWTGSGGRREWGAGFGPRERAGEDNWKEDGWKERIILGVGVISLVLGLFPSIPSTLVSPFLPPTSSTTTIPPAFTSSSPPPQHPTSKSPSTPIQSQSQTTTTLNSAQPSVSPDTNTNTFPLPFIDRDKTHRAAVSALVQARQDREEIGRERREAVKRRAREMNTGVGSDDSGTGVSRVVGSGAGVKDDGSVEPSAEQQRDDANSDRPEV